MILIILCLKRKSKENVKGEFVIDLIFEPTEGPLILKLINCINVFLSLYLFYVKILLV